MIVGCLPNLLKYECMCLKPSEVHCNGDTLLLVRTNSGNIAFLNLLLHYFEDEWDHEVYLQNEP